MIASLIAPMVCAAALSSFRVAPAPKEMAADWTLRVPADGPVEVRCATDHAARLEALDSGKMITGENE